MIIGKLCDVDLQNGYFVSSEGIEEGIAIEMGRTGSLNPSDLFYKAGDFKSAPDPLPA